MSVSDYDLRKPRERKPLKFLDYAEYIYPAPKPDLIAGCVEQGAQMLLFGQPSAGKSSVAMQWAVHIAAGIPWLGHDVEQGRVLYILGEGREDRVMQRFHSIGSVIGADPQEVTSRLKVLIEPSFKLDDHRSVDHFLEDMDKVDTQQFDLIVLDTYSTLTEVDTNSSQETMKANDGIKTIKQAPQFRLNDRGRGPTVICIMHEAKQTAESKRATAMGSNSQMGNVDVAMRMKVERDAKGDLESFILQRNIKNRDGADQPDIHLVPCTPTFSHTTYVDDVADETFTAVLTGFTMKLKDAQMPGKVRDAFNWYLTQWENNGDQRPTAKSLATQAKIDDEPGWGGKGGASEQFNKFRKYNLVDDKCRPLVERLPQSDSVDQQVLDVWGTSVVGEEDE